MPKGLPSASQLLSGEIAFFSLDTSVIQASGYRFDTGALHALSLQLPKWITLQLSEVVSQEVQAHRLRQARDSKNQLASAIKLLARNGLDTDALETASSNINVDKTAGALYSAQIARFIQSHNGRIVPINGPNLAKELFALYFAARPPFENNKDKKAEFPDAAALLTLETHAKDINKLGFLVSADAGWSSFADTSDHLFCVGSIDEFTALFASNEPAAKNITDKLETALSGGESALREQLTLTLTEHLQESYWRIHDIYTSGNHRVDGEVNDATLVEFTMDSEPRVWFVKDEKGVCVVQQRIYAEVELSVAVELFVWDSIDREELRLGSFDTTSVVDVEIGLVLTCEGDFSQPPTTWHVEMETGSDTYSVDIGEVEPEFGNPDEE